MQSSVLISGVVGYEDIHLPGRERSSVLGGSGLYAAIAAAQFVRCCLISAVGEDIPLKKLFACSPNNLDISNIVVSGKSSFELKGRYGPDMNILEILATKLGPQIPLSQFETSFTANVLLLVNEDPLYQLELTRKCDYEALIYVVCKPWLKLRPAECMRLAQSADLVQLSLNEERFVPNLSSLLVAGKIVILTRGKEGVEVISECGRIKCPAPKIEEDDIIDVTGAGDVLSGAVAGSLAASGQPITVMKIVESIASASRLVRTKLATCGAEEFYLSLYDKLRSKNDCLQNC